MEINKDSTTASARAQYLLDTRGPPKTVPEAFAMLSKMLEGPAPEDSEINLKNINL